MAAIADVSQSDNVLTRYAHDEAVSQIYNLCMVLRSARGASIFARATYHNATRDNGSHRVPKRAATITAPYDHHNIRNPSLYAMPKIGNEYTTFHHLIKYSRFHLTLPIYGVYLLHER